MRILLLIRVIPQSVVVPLIWTTTLISVIIGRMMPELKQHAARVTLSLAAILMTSCQANPAPTPLIATATLVVQLAPTATKTLVVPSPTTPLPTVTSSPTPMPSATMTVAPTPTPPMLLTHTPAPPPTELKVTPANGVNVYETTLTLPTYPMKKYEVEQLDPVYNLPVFYLNRRDYEAAAPAPQPVIYQAVVLENEYLRLTFLPELGGRLYSAVVKVTEQEIFYHNSVVKPSVYGPLPSIDGVNPNSWLALGGMEWAYPVQEHGYRWGVPWTYKISQTASQATITLSDMGEQRVGAEVSVTLLADAATFTVQPKLVNQTAVTVPVQFWLNAALTLGAPTISPHTQFIIPTSHVTVHSRGEAGWAVPDAHATMPWPQVGGLDLQNYGQWTNYLGFFAPQLTAPFMGAYNPDSDLGVVRFMGQAQGNKLFAFSSNFPDRSYTDDNSQYFELWGSLNQGFWAENDLNVAPTDSLSWQETWWPLAQLGGLTYASPQVALAVTPQGTAYQIRAQFAQPTAGLFTVFNDDIPFLTEPFTATPAQSLTWLISPLGQHVRLEWRDEAGQILLNYVVKE